MLRKSRSALSLVDRLFGPRGGMRIRHKHSPEGSSNGESMGDFRMRIAR